MRRPVSVLPSADVGAAPSLADSAKVVVWGLVFLLLHLTLYPFPDITHLLNPTGQ